MTPVEKAAFLEADDGIEAAHGVSALLFLFIFSQVAHTRTHAACRTHHTSFHFFFFESPPFPLLTLSVEESVFKDSASDHLRHDAYFCFGAHVAADHSSSHPLFHPLPFLILASTAVSAAPRHAAPFFLFFFHFISHFPLPLDSFRALSPPERRGARTWTSRSTCTSWRWCTWTVGTDRQTNR